MVKAFSSSNIKIKEFNMFCLNEEVVYPGYGVAKINKVIKKVISDKEITFYELTFLNKDVTILVPTENIQSIGLRPSSTSENIKDAFNTIHNQNKENNQYSFLSTNWNKRNKEYQLKLRNGTLKDLLYIYKNLKDISNYKELSFGEKNILQQAESLLAEEIAVVEKVGPEKATEQLRSLFVIQNNINNRAKSI